jgi:hypothetical protein
MAEDASDRRRGGPAGTAITLDLAATPDQAPIARRDLVRGGVVLLGDEQALVAADDHLDPGLPVTVDDDERRG